MMKIDLKKYKKNLYTGFSFSLILFIISFIMYLKFSYMGATDKEIERYVFSHYSLFLILYNLKILLTYFLFGAVILVFSIMLDIKRKRMIFGFNFVIWFLFWIRGVKMFPQLFKEQLYNHSSFLKYFQIFITDYLPMFAIYAFFIGFILYIGYRNKRYIQSIFVILISFLLIYNFKVSPSKADYNLKKPNILIFATDSLRPKSISYNGYFRKAPNIDKLFSKGVNFLNLKSSLARTFSSWTSIFTSTLPIEHGVRHMFPLNKDIEKDWKTLVKDLNNNGYETSVVSDFAGDIFSRIDYGFKNISAPHLTLKNVLKQRSLEIHYFLLGVLINPIGRTLFPQMSGMPLNIDPYYVTEKAKSYIKNAVKKKKPFLVLSFSSNNHFPYATKYPYYSMYEKKGYSGKHKYCKDDMIKAYSGYDLPLEDKKQVIGLYDAATRLFDDNLGDMLKFLKRSNLDKSTIIIIMSDHGESLYEKGLGIGHGDHLRGEYSHSLTFGVYSPFEEFKGRIIGNTARDIDITPTILELAGMKIKKYYRGISLLKYMRGEKFSGLPVYMETGMWYSLQTPYINNKVRINYPEVKALLDLDKKTGEIIIKKSEEALIVKAKYKAYQFNNKKFVFMPGEKENLERFYIDEKFVELSDKEKLNFKNDIIEKFNGKFYIDDKGIVKQNKFYKNKLTNNF